MHGCTADEYQTALVVQAIVALHTGVSQLVPYGICSMHCGFPKGSIAAAICQTSEPLLRCWHH